MTPLQTLALSAVLILAASACGAPRYVLDDAELARFMAAGPVVPELDGDALLETLQAPGPYRVVESDLLAIHVPNSLLEIADGEISAGVKDRAHGTRVSRAGTIVIPLAGEVEVRGLTLPEIEEKIVSALHPDYLKARPSIVVMVEEYSTSAVSVVGAVEAPGLHRLRSDELTLYGALHAAGGIVKSNNLVVGARLIRIHGADGAEREGPIVLPVKGLNIPYTDLGLRGGERIEVERYEPDTFTVVGLVAKPGAYEYPPEVTYNLMQALAVAGGVDLVANPPYATVFRREEDGHILPATFEIDGDGLVAASGLEIKAGDVIAVQHTPASWTRSFVAEVFRLQIGLFVDKRPD